MALTLAFAVACAGDDEEETTAAQQPAAPSPPSAAAAAQTTATDSGAVMAVEPKVGGQFNVWRTADPTIWDVRRGVEGDTTLFLNIVYESLLGYKYGEGVAYEDLTLVPELAESWEVNDDATVFTWHLRKGVKWANVPPVNGREVTSEDVKFSLEYVTGTGEFGTKAMKEHFKDVKLSTARYSYMATGIASVETPDRYTAVVTFEKPFAPYLSYSVNDGTRIQPREIYEQDGHMRDLAIGTSPFQMDWDDSRAGSRWIAKANPDYGQERRPYLDSVRALVILDASTALAAFRVGQLDFLTGSGHTFTDIEAQEILGGNADAVVTYTKGASPRHMYFNVRRPPFDDERVRKAVDLAIDRKEFIRVFEDGAGALVLPGAFLNTFTEAEIEKIIRYDPEEAKRLLAEAGYANGLDLDFPMSVR
jgi:peptide/nickel transport system substrate-binding protein